MLLVLMTIYSFLGYLAHLSRDPITGHMRRGHQDMTNYGIGILLVFPIAKFMFHYLKSDVENADTRFSVTYILSFVSFGIGVYVGHWHKPVKE